jgi:hypothetical protein
LKESEGEDVNIVNRWFSLICFARLAGTVMAEYWASAGKKPILRTAMEEKYESPYAVDFDWKSK